MLDRSAAAAGAVAVHEPPMQNGTNNAQSFRNGNDDRRVEIMISSGRPKSRKRRIECCGRTMAHYDQSAPTTASSSHSSRSDSTRRTASSRDCFDEKCARRRAKPRRPGRRTFHATAGVFMVPWLLSSSFWISSIQAEPFRSCLAELERADSDNNNVLSEHELRTVILSLSGGREPAAALLGSVIAASQVGGAVAGRGNTLSFVSDTQDDSLKELCTNIHEGIIRDAAHKMDIQLGRCLFAMSIGDTSRDGALARDGEYPRYANQVSGNQFGFSAPFASLPKTVRDVFDDFRNAATDAIDIAGAELSAETLDEDAKKKLYNLCQHTAIAVLSADTRIEESDDPTLPVFEPLSLVETRAGTTDDYQPSFTFAVCTKMMAFSDLSRDSFLDQSEYLRFVNRLSPTPYTVLPQSLLDSFSTLASSDGRISIDGSQPGQNAAEFEASLAPVCKETDLGIQGAANPATPVAGPVTPPLAVATPTSPTAKPPVASATGPPVAAVPARPPLAAKPSPPVVTPAKPPTATADSTFEPSFTFAICTRMMALSDLSRDDKLSDAEYYAFVNRLTSNAYSGDFSSLPASIQGAFDSLAPSGLLDIVGSKPGQNSADSATALQNICTATDKAIQDSAASTPTVPQPAVGPPASETPPAPASETPPAPASEPPPASDSFAASFTLATCTKMMAFSDVSRDGGLDEAEYFRFINRLIADPLPGSYATLPASLKDAFTQLSGGKPIDIAGSMPGQNVEDHRASLEKICDVTDRAIQAAEGEPPLAADETQPPTTPPDRSIEYDKCLRDMLVADNNRDNKLDETEYVRFISRNDDRYEQASEFTALSESLQSNFKSLAGSVGSIDVQGSRSGKEADDETTENLKKICRETGEALAVRGPTSAPVALVSGDTKVFNAIVVSNLQGLRAASLQFIMADLELAYIEFVRESISNYTKDDSFLVKGSGNSRHRVLPITKLSVDPTVDSLRDILCPEYAIKTNELCAAAFASFGVEYVDEAGAAQVADSLSAFIQERINPYLITALSVVNPNITVTVEGPFSPVDPSKVDFPKSSVRGDYSSGVSVGQVVAGSVVLLILIGTTFYCIKSQKFAPKMFKTKKKRDGGGKKAEDADKMESGSPYDKSNHESGHDKPGKQGEESDGNDDDESVSFSVQDEETTQRDKSGDNIFNVFQLGKKKSTNAADDVNILDNGTPGAHEEDFDDYAFDEPTELESKASGNKAFASAWGADKASKWGDSEWDGNKNDGAFGDSGDKSDSDDDDDDEDDDSMDGSSRGDSASKSSVGSALGMGLVDNGDWSDVMKATKFANNFDASFTSKRSQEEPSVSGSSSGSSNASPIPRNPDQSEDAVGQKNAQSPTPAMDQHRYYEYRRQVEELVRRAAPEELNNVPSMLEKFAGREDELITTLENMYARASSNRNFKGVHKSKGIRERDSRVTNNGNAEGSAVIAAASMINADAPARFDDDDSSYSGDDSRRSGSQSYTGSRSGSGSHSGTYSRRSDEDYGDGSFTGSRSASVSRRSDDRSHSGSGSRRHDDSHGSGSFSRSPSGSYRSGDGSNRSSRSGSYRSGDRSSRSGSYRSGDGSYRSGEGSYRSGEGSARSGSYRSGEGSYRSGEGSYRSGDGSYRSGDGSARSGSYRSGSYRSGSYRSGDGSVRSGSYRSGDGSVRSGSYRSGDGSVRSGSYQSGDGSIRSGSYRSGDGSVRSGSYRSGEGSARSGSYRSGEGSFHSRRSGSYSRSPSGSYDSRRSGSGSYDSRSRSGSGRSRSQSDVDYGYG